MKDIEVFELANGIRVVHNPIQYTKIIRVAIMFNIGSRDELPNEQGITHFWEHMAFKGTKKHNALYFIKNLESVGGVLNAYTSKENICFHVSVLDDFIDKAIYNLTEIVFNAIFPTKEIEREKQVILNEMSMYEDTPEDAIMDEFDELVFYNHPLGKNILGTQQTVSSFEKSHIDNFINHNINTQKIVVSIVGNCTTKKVKNIIAKYFENIPLKTSNHLRQPFLDYKPQHIKKDKPISQSHFNIGIPIKKLEYPLKMTFSLLSNILGGPGLNSKLNVSLREKNGLVYDVETQYVTFSDIALFSISFATEPKKLEIAKSLAFKEIKLLQTQKIAISTFNKLKQQFKAQISMSQESNSDKVLMLAKSILIRNEVRSLEYIFKTIDNINTSDIQDMANEFLDIEAMTSLTFNGTKV